MTGDRMTRAETTKWLGELLINRIDHRGSYWASEVSLDYGTANVRRIDFLQFEPAGTTCISDIEKGIFTCYEIKSCKADYLSGFGKNFIGEKNYLVMTMPTYKDIIKNCPPEDARIGILVAVPALTDVYDEFEDPHKPGERLSKNGWDWRWELKAIFPAHKKPRDRSMNELLFCILRSGH